MQLLKELIDVKESVRVTMILKKRYVLAVITK
jgi:hypothetical protein